MSKIFLTGGTGFIGSHVVSLLKDRGHQVSTFGRKDTNHLKSMVSDFKPEIALHLAWEGLPDYSWPMCTRNVELGLRVYETLLQNGCRKIITTGSCWEYGSLNSFVAAKTSLRLMGEALAQEKGASFIWTRLFFVYGPGQRETSLIPSVIQKIKKKQTPEIKNPKACHDFVYVKDVAKALVLLAENDLETNRVDIGSGNFYCVHDVVQTVLQVMSDETPSVLKVEGNEKSYCANISTLTQFGWKPVYDLTTGIRETIHDYL